MCAFSIEFSDLYAHKKEVPTGTLRLQRFTDVLKIREISNSCLATLFTYKSALFIIIYIYFLDLHRPSFLPGGNKYSQVTFQLEGTYPSNPSIPNAYYKICPYLVVTSLFPASSGP